MFRVHLFLTYRANAVYLQVDMMFTASGFGKEDEPDTAADSFLDMMGDEGGMIMDDDE